MNINILDYLERSVKQFPDKIAFADLENTISYQQLQRFAQRIGWGRYSWSLQESGDLRTWSPLQVEIDVEIHSQSEELESVELRSSRGRVSEIQF